MNVQVINRESKLLKELISRGINNTVQRCIENCSKQGKEPQEPDYIAFLSSEFVPVLYHILKLLFPKVIFSATGIYCHQKPLADYGESTVPEIGDILFVYIHTNRDGIKKHNSLLFQAKVNKDGDFSILSTEEHQLKLYTEWPQFSFKRAGDLNGEVFNIQPKTINDGAQYLILGDLPPIYGYLLSTKNSPMNCATPAKSL